MCWVYYKNIMENLISFVTIKFLLASFRKKKKNIRSQLIQKYYYKYKSIEVLVSKGVWFKRCPNFNFIKLNV